MGAVKRTVPINVNIYLPKTTFNPYVRHSVSYANLGTATLTENASLASPNSISDSLAVGTWTDLPGDTTAMSYKPLAGSLAGGEEHEVFTLVFIANTGFHFGSNGKSLVKKRIITNHPKKAKHGRDLFRDKERTKEQSYADRWRFVETASNLDSDKLPKTVTIVAHYTAPDFRDSDALNVDGTASTNAVELLKNRGILLVPMLKKSTAAISAAINSIDFTNTVTTSEGFIDNVDSIITVYRSLTKRRSLAIIRGTSGATGTLHGIQETGVDLFVSKDFTIGTNNVASVDLDLPQVASDEFKFHITSTATLHSSIPIHSSPKTIYKFAPVTIAIIASQTGSSFHTGSGGFSADTIMKGPALTEVNRRKLGAVGTVSANHATLNKNQQGGIYYAFSLQINPLASGGSDDLIVINPRIGDGGFLPSTFAVTNSDTRANGGTVASLHKVKIVQSGANVLIVGYVFLQKIGKSNVVLGIPVDNFLTVT